jgi:hypothetical protein
MGVGWYELEIRFYPCLFGGICYGPKANGKARAIEQTNIGAAKRPTGRSKPRPSAISLIRSSVRPYRLRILQIPLFFISWT